MADLAKKIGGYNELIRLEAERQAVQKLGQKTMVVQDSQGFYRVIAKPE